MHREAIKRVNKLRHTSIQKFMGLAFAFFWFVNPVHTIADWRKDVGVFRIGVVAKSNAVDAVAKIEPFRLAISEALGINVEIFAAKNFKALIDAQVAARIEYAIYSATSYATAWKICECIEPVVIPKSSDGTISYKSVLISTQNGPENIANKNADNVIALSENSFAGNEFARFELKSQGVELPEKFKFSSSGEQAISLFMREEKQILIGWSSLNGDPNDGYTRGTLRQIAELNGGKITPYRVIWSSSPIPHRPHVIRKSLDGEAKKLLRDVLSRMFDSDPVAYDSIEPVFGGGFVVARHGQFLPIISYVESLETIEPTKAEAKTAPEKNDSN